MSKDKIIRKRRILLFMISLSISFIFLLTVDNAYLGKAEAGTVTCPAVADLRRSSDSTSYLNDDRITIYGNGYNIYNYIRFDTSAVPNDAVIKSARMYLYVTYTKNENRQSFTRNLTGSSTWIDDDIETFKDVTTGVITGETKTLGSYMENTWVSWDIKDIAQYWIDTESAGVFLQSGGGGADAYYRMGSSEYADDTKRPYVNITYNFAPTLNLTTSDNQGYQEVTNFTFTTSDPDPEDTLTYIISAGTSAGGTQYNSGLSHITGAHRGTLDATFDTSVIPVGDFIWNSTNQRFETTVYLRVTVNDGNGGTDTKDASFTVYRRPIINLTTQDNQTLSENPGNDVLTLSGTVKEYNIGSQVTLKYTIENVTGHQDVSFATITADGTDQPFNYGLTIDDSIPEGTHTITVWAEDINGGKSIEPIRTFVVDKTIHDPAIRSVTSQEKSYTVHPITGNYSLLTSPFLSNNFGSGKPFYINHYTYKFTGITSEFSDFGFTMAYIGMNKFRVVTSEGKAFDVDKDTGECIEVTNTFMNNNFGPGKPFYNKTYENYINGYGPFNFYDFGSTMAYIGNNTLRVVTSEGKAFDVNVDDGTYTDITSTFLVNNFGSGKPFYLKTYTHDIGGTATTFYDFGSTMAYIGNNTLRVVTSEGKAFDVDVNTGAFTDVTGTFIVNNLGSEKPFYHNEYINVINDISYTFHDFSSAMAYINSYNPSLTIETTGNITAFETITLTGTVTDTNNSSVTVSAAINGISKSTVVNNTATPQEWSLTWDIAADNITDGIYSNIAVQGDTGSETTSSIYRGAIYVFGPDSNLNKKTVNYEYDDNGKLTRRYLLTTP